MGDIEAVSEEGVGSGGIELAPGKWRLYFSAALEGSLYSTRTGLIHMMRTASEMEWSQYYQETVWKAIDGWLERHGVGCGYF